MAGFELKWIDWLRDQCQRGAGVVESIGDDLATLWVGAGPLLLGSDMIVDGVHFDSAVDTPSAIGRKAMASCLSDCAAMAVRPRAALASICFPSCWCWEKIEEFGLGLIAMAQRFEVPIVGGDTTSGPTLVVDVCIVAEPYLGAAPVTRRGARIGDCIYTSGLLGGSILGKHLAFLPRIHEAKRLATLLGERLHAMMDSTDGASLDAWKMMKASKKGCILDESALLQVASVAALTSSLLDGRAVLDHVLHDGEDFELLLAVDAAARMVDVELFPIGEVTEKGHFLRRLDGSVETLEPKGYVH